MFYKKQDFYENVKDIESTIYFYLLFSFLSCNTVIHLIDLFESLLNKKLIFYNKYIIF